MKKRFLSILCILAMLLNGMAVYASENNQTIKDVELPCGYTELYASLNIAEPEFYDTLDCKVNGVDEKVNVTWTSSDYVANQAGTYTFNAVVPDGYTFEETPEIRVRVRVADGDTNNDAGVTHRGGYIFSRDTDASGDITGFYGTAKPGTSKAVRIVDVTGFNKIRQAELGDAAVFLGGVDYSTSAVGAKYATNPTELTAKIGLNGTTMTAMYGGSYGNIFKGTTDIYVTDGTLKTGIYAGSLNGEFEGTTNIYISGNSNVPKLYLGSTYNNSIKVNGAVVGKSDVSYKGTVNVYIADDFTGSIEAIEEATGANDNISAYIYISDSATGTLPTGLKSRGKIKVYKGGELVKTTVDSVTYDGETEVTVATGTEKEDIKLDGILTLGSNGEEYKENDFTWDDGGYSPDMEGTYTFTPILPDCYVASEGVTLPTVTVQVDDGHVEVIDNVILPFEYTELYANLNVSSPMFYDTLSCKIGGKNTTISGVTWTSEDYVANQAGTYTFSAIAPAGYIFAENSTPTITVRVRVADGDTNHNAGVTHRGGYIFSRDTDDSGEITGFYGTAKKAADATKAVRIVDVTGYNGIRKAELGDAAVFLGGVDYSASAVGAKYAANPIELTAKIGLDGTTMTAMYGGSYGNIFKGTTDIYVTDGTLKTGIYAGSLNGEFEGTTNIYISGNSNVPKLYLGSTYNKNIKVSSAVVGKSDVSYKGTVNVYIADDFTGSIEAIEAATGANDDVIANIYITASIKEKLPDIVGGSRVNLYVDNELASKSVTAIPYDGESLKNVPLNTAEEELSLADILEIQCGDVTYMEKNIEWECKEGYSPTNKGYYTFTPILPESYVLSDTSMLPAVTVLVKDGVDTITAVDLPSNYTELYTGLVPSPVFYDTLTCKIDGVDTTVLGFTWTCDNYDSKAVGTYTFTAKAPLGYQFAEGATPTITVRVREAEVVGNNNGVRNRFGHFLSSDMAGEAGVTGFYGAVVPGFDDSTKTRVVDFTGYNTIFGRDTSNDVRLVGGVDYATTDKLTGTTVGDAYAANPTELTSKIGLNGSKMHSMYGGSYGNIFKGTTDIHVKDGNVTNGIYAGSVNGDFEGTTNIYLSGNSIIKKLHLGSIYSKNTTDVYKGTIVGKEDVSYNGTINVYIADDFTGSIGEIVVPDGEKDSIGANIYMSSACEFDIFSLGYEGAKLYIDGKDASHYMSEVSYDGENFIVVPIGTLKKNIKFDGILTIIYGGKEYTETEVEWDCEDYNFLQEGEYIFKPVIPSKYEPNNTPVLPEVKVLVENSMQIDSINVGIPLETRLPEDVTELNTPVKATITYTHNGETHTSEIEISYNTKNYKSKEGEYTFSIDSVQKPFKLSAEAAKMAEIKVEVAADLTVEKSGDSYLFDNAMVAVQAEERGVYTITDVSRLHTYYEDIAVINAMEITGKNPALTIDSPLVYIEDAISFKDIEGEAKAEVANSFVTKIRTECPDQVIVDGISLGSFEGKTVTEVTGKRNEDASEKGTLYFNGIPGILARGEDGGTYAYRSYDMKKLSDTNLAGWDVCGGSQGENSVTAKANVRFESGTVYRLFGGGQGTTKDATMVLDGGAVAWVSHGGALENGTVQKATVVYEYGDSKRKAYVGGEEGSVLGEKDKVYGKDEYAAEVWLFDCAIQYVTLGGKRGEIYGNIKYEQHGGKLIELYTGGYKANHYGDVDITVYAGMWEKLFRQQDTHEGNARLKLYEGIHREEFIVYPTFEKQNASNYTLEVEYFDRPDNFQFIEYEDKRAEVVDTSDDAGKLVVRFLETKVDDGFEKGTVKIRYGTGDSIYIIFPNGQNMLIDTGMTEGGKFIVQDLKDLGVQKLDYLLITHDHHDHIGAIEAISEAFEVKNLLYQKFNTNSVLQTVADAEGAKVQILGAGDVLTIGEGETSVRFDVIGPNDKLIEDLKEEGDYDVNHSSIAMVMSYGDAKAFFGADSLYENEKAWLGNEEITKLISDCQLLKLNHHGIFNANTPEFLDVVNADKFVITQMREYGTQLGQAVAQLEGAFGVTWDDIFVTGRHGMIKAVLGKDGTVDMSRQYVEASTSTPDPTSEQISDSETEQTPNSGSGNAEKSSNKDSSTDSTQKALGNQGAGSQVAAGAGTGDSAPIFGYILLLVIAAATMIVALAKKHKKEI